MYFVSSVCKLECFLCAKAYSSFNLAKEQVFMLIIA